MQSERRRTRPAGSSFCATAKPSVTSRDAMRLRPLTASSSSSTIRRSGTRRTKATSSPSSTHTSARRRGRHALTSRTSASGSASRTSSTQCSRTIWPPSASKTATSNRCPLLRDFEVADHPAEMVRVALVRVATGLECDRPGRLSLEGDAGLLVQAGAEEVKVVDRGLVLDLDPVLTGLDPFEILTALLHLDAEAGTDLAGQSRRLGVGGCDDQGGCCKCEECHSEHDLPPRVC